MIDYQLIIMWCDYAVLIGYAILLLAMFYYFLFFMLGFKKPKIYPKGKNKYKYCVIIPARNESRVINNILNALKDQTYDKDKFDVYVIIESIDDPTYKIVQNFGYKVFIRKDLQNKNTKGYAIQELIDYLNNEHLKEQYDSYIIFDADNVMNKDYIDKLNDLKNAGFQIGFGYRNFTNANKNWVTACSAILFSLINQVFSKGRSILFKKIMINGTGYFIDRKIIDDIGKWIFTGMTEDVQVSTYATYHNIAMGYNETTQYYDEEPTRMNITHKQHIRWIWGFLASRKLYKKKNPNYHSNKEYVSRLTRIEFNLSVWPVVMYVVFILVAYLVELGLFFSSLYFDITQSGWLFAHSIIPFASLYFLFFIIAIFVLAIDNRHLKLNFWMSIGSVLTFAFFFYDFIFAFLDGLFHPKKRKIWSPIVHKGEIINHDALENKK